MILLNGPPGVGKSTIGRRVRDDRPRSLLVDFDELWLLIGDWQQDGTQELAVAAGLAMAGAHLHAGHDVVAPQFTVAPHFFEDIDALVGETGAVLREIVLTGDPHRVATQFRRRRAERVVAGEADVSSNIPDDRIDEVIAKATEELGALAATRPRTLFVSTDRGVETTYRRLCELLS